MSHDVVCPKRLVPIWVSLGPSLRRASVIVLESFVSSPSPWIQCYAIGRANDGDFGKPRVDSSVPTVKCTTMSWWSVLMIDSTAIMQTSGCPALQFPGWATPGKYVMQYQWSGYYDCWDIQLGQVSSCVSNTENNRLGPPRPACSFPERWHVLLSSTLSLVIQ